MDYNYNTLNVGLFVTVQQSNRTCDTTDSICYGKKDAKSFFIKSRQICGVQCVLDQAPLQHLIVHATSYW